jgi:CHAT domain-containing protein/Tfp pilus assembly protein PilF
VTNSRAIVALSCLGLGVIGLLQFKKPSPAPVGIVIDAVQPGSAGARAGIQPGDVLLSWRRAGLPSPRSEIRVPSDISRIEIEEGPRGDLRLVGLRENGIRIFELPQGSWGVTARPQRPPAALCESSDRNTGDDWWARASLHDGCGSDLLRKGQVVRAAAEFRKGLDIAVRHAPDSLLVAHFLERLGAAAEYAENPVEARDLHTRALVIRQRAAPDSAAVASSLGALGRVASRNESAEDLLARSLALWEELAPDSIDVASASNDLGAFQFQHGNVAAARDLHERALAISTRLEPGGLDQAASLYRLGNVAWRRGDLASAEELHQKALAIRRAHAPESAAVESSLNSLGNVAGSRKDLESAQRFHRQALAIGEKRAPHSIEPMLHNLGEDARLLGDYATAEALLRRALGMYDRMPPGSGREVAIANTLVSLAAVARDRGDLPEAETIVRRALAIRAAYEPDSLHLAEDREVLADILWERGRQAEAREEYLQILRVASRTVPSSELEARTLHSLGLSDRAEGRTAQAAEMFGRAIDALDSQKGRLGGAIEARELFSAAYADMYRDLIEALADLGRIEDAFWILERSQARLLLAMLAERELMLASNVAPGLEEDRARADAEYDRTQRQLRDLSPSQDAARLELLDRLAALRDRRSDTIERIKKASPRYASLRYPRPLDLEAARRALDPGTLLLSYSVGTERALLFAVEPSGAKGSGLTVFPLSGNSASLREAVASYRNMLNFRGPRAPDTTRNLLARSRSLYASLLEPAEALIARYDRLLIRPDGPLHTLPWAALARSSGSDAPDYLVESKPIHTTISATVYAELKKARLALPRDPSVMVAAFGDPLYPKLPDSRVAVERGGARFDPLPESRREVLEIAALYSPKSEVYLGPEATEERATAIGTDVPLIHFACHAVLNERFPLDSALVFTIPEKPREGQDNGLLQAWEIFERVRIDADLVTLSACESGLGKETGGEGLIGLTRAFQYAGARSVLASLWKVEDKPTAELMKRFYVNLKAGRTKDEALRLAQIDLICSPGYSHPKDWAAFQLNGDWK